MRLHHISVVAASGVGVAGLLLVMRWVTEPWALLTVVAGGVAVQVLLARKLCRVQATLAHVAGALSAYAAGITDSGVLQIRDPKVEPNLAAQWNQLIEDLQASREARKEESIAAVLREPSAPTEVSTALFDAMPLGLLLIDHTGHVTLANGAASRLLMRSRDRLLRAPCEKLLDDTALQENIRQMLVQPDCRSTRREITLNPDTEQLTILRVTLRSLGDPSQRQLLMVLEDLTQQRTADRARNLFVAQATHELRTPLTNIGLYVERAIDLSEQDVAERSECLSVINAEVTRLSRLVEEVLSVSEIEAGSLKVRHDDVKLDLMIEQMRQEYRPQATAKNITMAFALPPKLTTLQGDRDKVALALHNLLGNAIKYTPAGGNVQVKVFETESDLVVEVSDTGMGIADSDLPRIFDKFYRAADERLAGIPGTGLGLALAREVVRLHGGDITAESVLNEGSTFRLSIPLERNAVGA